MVNETVSHYKILEKIGEGGMGVVYKAHDTRLDRTVALKFLSDSFLENPTIKSRFLHEAKGASAIQHKNITVVHDLDEAEGKSFIVMEYVEGHCLTELAKAGLSLRRILDLAVQITEGLAAAHKSGIVHRDVKSENITVTPDGTVKIMDFGLAKLKGATQVTGAGTTLGTVAYMSPEQAKGVEVDARTDIFSFGVVLYELLTGQLPFKGEHIGATLFSILNEHPKPPSQLNADVPAELDRIVLRCLAKNRDERYPSADVLLIELVAFKEGIRTPSSPSAPATPPVPSHRPKKFVLPSLVVAALLGVLVFFFNPLKIQISRDRGAEAYGHSLAVMYFENLTDPADREHTGEMLSNLLITSLSQNSGLEVISRERLYDIQAEMGETKNGTVSPALAGRIAQRAGVTTMLLGSILQTRPNLTVTFRLVDVQTGKIQSSHRLAGFGTEKIFPMVDSMAVLVSKGLDLGPDALADAKSVADVTTDSPEAYRSYVEGVELYKKLFLVEARAAFRRAVELDSNFAMAYFRLSLTDEMSARKRALEKAWQLKERVTEKERLQIEAAYANQIEYRPERAAEILEQLLKKHPRNVGGYEHLSHIYQTLGRHEMSVATLLAGLKVDTLAKSMWNLLGYNYAGLNQKRRALEAIDHYLRLAPGEPNPYDSKGEIYFVFGNVDSANLWYQKALSLRADFVTTEKVGFNALLAGRFGEAEQYFTRMKASGDREMQEWAEYSRATILMRQGRLLEARRMMQKQLARHEAESLAVFLREDLYCLFNLCYAIGDFPGMLSYAQRYSAWQKKDPTNKFYARHLLAWAHLKNGNRAEAHRLMEELKEDVCGKQPNWQTIFDYSSGILSLEEGDFEAASGHFKKALATQYPNRAPQFAHAVSLLQTGRLSQGIHEMERVTWWTPISTPVLSLNYLPQGVLWPVNSTLAHYWLGTAYEKMGNSERAREEYREFLRIWKAADVDTPELKDARSRFAKLEGLAAK